MPNFANDTPPVGSRRYEIESRPVSCESITLTQDRSYPIDELVREDSREFVVKVTSVAVIYVTFDLWINNEIVPRYNRRPIW